MMGPGPQYLPALRFRWLTRFFDPLIAFALEEGRLRDRLIDQADVEPEQRVLDLGCGTGSLLLRPRPVAQARGPSAWTPMERS